MIKTQLLCSFTTKSELEETLRKIIRCYDIAFNSIYVLENLDDESSLCCTYNIITTSNIKEPVPPSTISLHRKKLFNSLYTINALNELVAEQNGGVPDKNFKVNWDELRNTILVMQYDSLKKIRTKVKKIIRIDTDLDL